MTTRKYEKDLKHKPEELFDFLKSKAEEKGWRLDGDAQNGTFSAGPLGVVSGKYEVRGNTVYITVQCPISSAWGEIEKGLNVLFG